MPLHDERMPCQVWDHTHYPGAQESELAAISANESSESNSDDLRLMSVLGILPLCEFLDLVQARWSSICRLAQIAAINSGPSTRLQNA